MVDVRPATRHDAASWSVLVREVEPLFGPMPDFDIGPAVDRGGAFCVRDADGNVAGGMLLSTPDKAKINWLAVRANHRRRGFGRALVARALLEFNDAEEVIVDTFGDDVDGGRPARRLYESFGFVASEELEPGPEGGSRQRYRLARSRPAAGPT